MYSSNCFQSDSVMDLTENSHHLFGLIHITMCECCVSLMIIRNKIFRIPEKGQYNTIHVLAFLGDCEQKGLTVAWSHVTLTVKSAKQCLVTYLSGYPQGSGVVFSVGL